MEKGEILRTYSPVRVTLLALHDARALPDIPARGKHGICTARLAEIQSTGRRPTRAAPRPLLVRTTPTRRASVGKEKTRKAQAPARAQPLADLAPKRSAHYKPNRTLAVTRRPRRPRPSCCRAFCLISSYYNTTTTTTGWMDGRTCRTRRGRGVVRVRARCVSLRRRGVESRAQRAIDDHSAGPGGVYAYSRRRCGCAWLSLEKRGFSGACRDRVWLAAQE
jgi:hypothetical protein